MLTLGSRGGQLGPDGRIFQDGEKTFPIHTEADGASSFWLLDAWRSTTGPWKDKMKMSKNP